MMADVVGGVLWATEQATKLAAANVELTATGKTRDKGSVANMALGGDPSQSLNDVINKAVKSGTYFAVAAGNSNRDACSCSTASAEEAITINASSLGDDRAYFPNHSQCVDIFAPGECLDSVW